MALAYPKILLLDIQISRIEAIDIQKREKVKKKKKLNKQIR
jgi:hypothetical protein